MNLMTLVISGESAAYEKEFVSAWQVKPEAQVPITLSQIVFISSTRRRSRT